jgi:hypothetical protein
MFTFFSRALTRVAMIAALAGAGLIIADGASAKPWGFGTLPGTHSRGEIIGACAAAGGTYNDDGNKANGTQGAHYGCTTDQGTVQCSDGGDGGQCSSGCAKCADFLPKKGGIKGQVGGAGNARGTVQAHSVSSNKVKPVVAASHFPLKKLAGGRAARAH